MEGRTLAIATYGTKLDDDFRIESEDPDERATIERGMTEVEARIESDMDPVVAASQMDTDEIVELHALRDWLVALVEMTYQATSQRRIKNCRIWSLHDLALLGARGPVAARAEGTAAALAQAPKSAIDVHGLVFCAPLAGRVYFRPSPDKPRFVETGGVITRGTTVCMLEVMKSFNRIAYGGESLPEHARVVGFLVEDGADVEPGTPILRLADCAASDHGQDVPERLG
jgi:biotin carboxyl carrier protein